MTKAKRHNGRLYGLTVAAMALLLTACDKPAHSPDYRESHQIQVIEEVVTLGLSVPQENGRIVSSERNGFSHFTRIFHTRGKDTVTIYVDETKSGGVSRDELIKRIARGLKGAGIASRHVRVMPGDLGHEGAAPVMLTFDAYQAIAPECGDWSEGHSYNWTNDTHANYGCAYQRNLASSIANPGDLLKNQPMSTYDGVRGVVNILTYQAGGSGGGAEGATAE